MVTFIPRDTDVDLVVLAEDKHIAINLLKTELSYKYYFNTNRDRIAPVYLSNINKLHTDIYFWESEEECFFTP